MSERKPSDDLLTREFEITNPLGIHARPAALFVKIASQYDGDVKVQKDDMQVSGKSIMGLMTLQASCGSKLRVSVENEDGIAVLDALEDLIRRGFDE